MAFTQEEAQKHAARIIKDQHIYFSDVYEDEELEDLEESDWDLVYDQIKSATVEVTF